MFDERSLQAIDAATSQRSAVVTDAEVVAIRDGFVFDGHAAVFDSITDLPQWTEEIRRGAFRKVLAAGANVPFLVEHDPAQLLGTTRSGRVRLVEDAKGLRVQANLADTDLSRRVKALVESGDVTGMSFGFVAGRGNAKWTQGTTKPHRTLHAFERLTDVCTTYDPAYADAEAQFRSLALANPGSADSLQQLLAGVYPQLEEQGNEEAPIEPPVLVEDEDEQRDTGAIVVAGTPRLAARRRQLQLLTLTLEGDKT